MLPLELCDVWEKVSLNDLAQCFGVIVFFQNLLWCRYRDVRFIDGLGPS